ncbi:hypothetical protein N7492_009342 [Penicillium capsulatum]|uniref:Uncharacterized protein n=1 Tax=Penicillium capsulatum TaxID=69766 RepID=A0A9W9LHN7_9EURO|nr:hypothetical protein N7492_009342 [Penicillium capsulatum]KAJ6106735.1 hypothetical protein N7512_010252 [Penicillium capsulatum]
MSNDRSTSPITVPDSDTRPRRGSIADLFTKHSAPQSTAQAANAQANQRRLSISTLGLSGSPTQPANLGNPAFRRGSLSSSWGSNAPNSEDALAEDAEGSPPSATPQSPFHRRVSFGAQALREARSASTGNGRYPLGSGSSIAGARPTAGSASARSPAASILASSPDEPSNASRRLGEGFNWSEALRSRAERAPSLSGPVSPTGRQPGSHQRAASVASIEQPVREIPKQPKQNKPDFFQEKILRGDFMD